MKVTFDLVDNRSSITVKSFSTLYDCVKHVRMSINEPRNYSIEEMEDGDMVETCSAYYLLENYKDLEKLPVTLFDI